jgi:hypothetical protein
MPIRCSTVTPLARSMPGAGVVHHIIRGSRALKCHLHYTPESRHHSDKLACPFVPVAGSLDTDQLTQSCEGFYRPFAMHSHRAFNIGRQT